MKKRHFQKGEKLLLAAIVFAALLLGAGAWRGRMDALPAIVIPNPTLPSPNGYDYFVRAVNAHRAATKATPNYGKVDQVTDGTSHAGASAAELARIYPTAGKEAWLRKDSLALALLRQGLTYQCCKPPDHSPTGMFSYYTGFRELGHLLMIESHARAERGNWTGASHSALDCMRMGHALPRGGALMDSLMGLAVSYMGICTMNEVLPHLDAAASRDAALAIERIEDNSVSASDSLREEMWHAQIARRDFMRAPNWRAASVDDDLPFVERAKMRARLEFVGRRRVMDNFTQYMEVAIAQSRQPYGKHAPVPPEPPDLHNKTWYIPFQSFEWNVARGAIKSRLIQMQLALRACRLERGAYPDKLSDLIPRYAKAVPADPFGSGGPLLYRRTGDNYLLYSVGPDGKDDGGKPLDDPKDGPGPGRYSISDPDAKGDIVAGINH